MGKQRLKFLLTNIQSNTRGAYYFSSPDDGYYWKELLPDGTCSAFQIFSLNVKFFISSKEPENNNNKKNKQITTQEHIIQ